MTVKTIGFLLIGGLHHILHLVPPAAVLSNRDDLSVIIFVMTKDEEDYCREVMTGLEAGSYAIEILRPSIFGSKRSPKISTLWANRKKFGKLDALVVVERTSSILRKLPGKLPLFIHIPHGAGDRARSYDKRIALFDEVIVAGEKDRTRMIELGLISEEHCQVSGYIKPSAIRNLHQKTPRFFKNENLTILYNPHFDPRLSSWPKFGRDLLETFVAHKDYNFIIAPHMRLKEKMSVTDITTFDAYSHIMVDLGSQRSTDMSYTRAADIYLGDVSSQVYEFLSGGPKPCVFFNAHDAQWQDDPDYAHWNFGPVVSDVEGVLGAMKTAYQTLPNYRDFQEERIALALGKSDWNPIERAADIIHDLVQAR